MRILLAATCFAAVGFPTSLLGSPCDGISDETWQNMERIALEGLSSGKSKGRVWTEIRDWMKTQDPPVLLAGEQERCWTRTLGKRFDDREKENAKLAHEALRAEFDSLSQIEKDWVHFQVAARLESIRTAKAAINAGERVNREELRAWEANKPCCVHTIDRSFRCGDMGRIPTQASWWRHKVLQVAGPDALIIESVHAEPQFRGITEIPAGTRFPSDSRPHRTKTPRTEAPWIETPWTKTTEPQHFWLQGVPTETISDGERAEALLSSILLRVIETRTYTTALGGMRTIPQVEVINVDPVKLQKFYGLVQAMDRP